MKIETGRKVVEVVDIGQRIRRLKMNGKDLLTNSVPSKR